MTHSYDDQAFDRELRNGVLDRDRNSRSGFDEDLGLGSREQ